MPRGESVDSFDYVVVGAGSAGCVVANRLSEDAGSSVVVLEAGGGDRHPFLTMPAAFTYAISNSRFDWGYESEVEPYLHNRRIPCPRGRVLGGSSSINAMAFVRGQAADFDAWAGAGLRDWSYADCLPYFRRLETFNGEITGYRGANGPLHVTQPRYSTPLNELFLEACAQAGYAVGIDVNGANQEGFGPMDQTIHRGDRESAARAYLRPAERRPNLTVVKHALVEKILFDGRRAVGIQYGRHEQHRRVMARREVILCAGAINSPQILMLSGIGDARDLSALGIPVVTDRPGVGRNLQDHVDISLKQLSTRPVTMTPSLSMHRKIPAFFNWALRKKGPGVTNHFEVAGYIRSSTAAERPDVQLCFVPLLVHYDGSAVATGHGYQMTIMALHPKSRGEIKLCGPDARIAPTIKFNYLRDPADMAPLRDGVARLREIIAQPAFGDIRGAELAPGPDRQSTEALDEFIRATAKSTHHPCGTCRMGDDASAVVDGEGRVHGVSGLRVVDAAIMPTITSGNINAPVYMMAEKISVAIRGRSALAPEI